ncbi:hypothetical protein R1flu_012170 [Riccia fluitans]|uniref:Uncharacterized protein n=1 Tax=Riccia fluitans TaxID=41844 RepID=A0ABD1ZAZ5_9MARC
MVQKRILLWPRLWRSQSMPTCHEDEELETKNPLSSRNSGSISPRKLCSETRKQQEESSVLWRCDARKSQGLTGPRVENCNCQLKTPEVFADRDDVPVPSDRNHRPGKAAKQCKDRDRKRDADVDWMDAMDGQDKEEKGRAKLKANEGGRGGGIAEQIGRPKDKREGGQGVR